MTDVLTLAGVLALAALLAWWLRARDGRVVGLEGARLPGAALRQVGVPPGSTALVEFTAPGCPSCLAAHDVLGAVAARYAGVVVVRADVGEHLDFARAHGVLRAPTTLVVDGGGRVRHRVHGVPDPAPLRAVLERTLARPRA